MEGDLQSQDSDEGVEQSPIAGFFADFVENFQEDSDIQPPLDAEVVYLLLPKNVPVSRLVRLQWLLDHLNTVVSIPEHIKWDDPSNTELEIISIIPIDQSCTKTNKFLITAYTKIMFLAHSYRFVYCLDMSPSHSTIDIQRGEILYDEILSCFKTSLEGLCKQFTVPGNPLAFQPYIYLTVIVNTPFIMSPAQQVIIKGVQISSGNLQEIFKLIENQFHRLECSIAQVSAMAHDQMDLQKSENDCIPVGISDLYCEYKSCNIPMVSPDANFVNMLRYSMLAISLLPENSLSNILVITDGVVAMPDSNIMESILLQLHYESITISFIKVGSTFHPHSSAGYVSYTDLLYFLSQSTMGTCLESFHDIKIDPSLSMNIYQKSYLLWTFHTKSRSTHIGVFDQHNWIMPNESFRTNRLPTLLSKRQTDENINTSILLLIARRMREGYTVDDIIFNNGVLEVKLCLQWKAFIYLHYHLSTQWPAVKNITHFEVHISAPYEFLHDITCIMKKEAKSLFRLAVIERFWVRLTQLASGDILLSQQLCSLQNGAIWYTLPESVKSGIPVFIINGNDATKLILCPSDSSCPKFVSIWQPISQLESCNWRKWLHVHKLSLILKHDHPLPKHLHLANSSGRFQMVQCRQAATALYGLLSDWASFILIDNHTYLKFLHHERDKPTWFCIVRVTSKLPCAVLSMGFMTSTPGYIRHEICEELKSELMSLSYPSLLKAKENICCVLLQKPLEKILIRYERMPNDFTTVIFPDGTQPPHSSQPFSSSPHITTLFTTLSRYLYHRRWIWSTTHPSNAKLGTTALSRILNTVTRMRLREGFSFAHSSSGIITMVLEFLMEPFSNCVVQYVLFPPNNSWKNEVEFTSGSEEEIEQDSEVDSEFQMVTEVWIEPQYGTIKTLNSRTDYMDNKLYYELADVVQEIDSQCINSLLTLEHLSLMCQEKPIDAMLHCRRSSMSNKYRQNSWRRDSRNNLLDCSMSDINPLNQRIQHIPFHFDPISILPRCHQTELLFSMFVEGDERVPSSCNVEKPNKLLLENIQDHLQTLHDRELELSPEDSIRFIHQIVKRHKNQYPHLCPISLQTAHSLYPPGSSYWRCFIKGISITHVILTFIPATLLDLKNLVNSDLMNMSQTTETTEGTERPSSRGSNFSDVPINISNSLLLPVYIFDCPLALLVSAYINHFQTDFSRSKDVYEDHRFKCGSIVYEDSVRLKFDDLTTNSPEPKSEESESNESKINVKQHCKALVLTHSKCFVMSLFSALHSKEFVHNADVQSAMDQCEETVYEIDITYYLQTVCGHLKQNLGDELNLQILNQPTPCSELKPLHRLIKEKFFKIIKVAFTPVPSNREFYYCHNLCDKPNTKHDSDDEVSMPPSEIEFRPGKNMYLLHSLSTNSEYPPSDISPLFLHLICTIKYNNNIANTSVKVLPTCLGEFLHTIESDTEYIEKSKLQITLDILCLTLPSEVQNIITDYSYKGLRATSFSSDCFQPSIASTTSEASFNSDYKEHELLLNLPDIQKKAIVTLREEIEWLLKDEIATALLDVEPVTSETLNLVIKHVANSNKTHSSCLLDVIDLNFVYGSKQSHEKFVQEFAKIDIPQYKLCKQGDFFYLEKNRHLKSDYNKYFISAFDFKSNYYFTQKCFDQFIEAQSKNESYSIQENNEEIDDISNKNDEIFSKNEEVCSQLSDISSINDSNLGTDGGYDEDVSEDDEDYEWLINLDNKRLNLPNFWLIMQINQDAVMIYFHCRFLELPTTHVGIYLEVQRTVNDAIRDLCKRVNQSLLLQSLHDTRRCSPLLEPDDTFKNHFTDSAISTISRNSSFTRLKSMDEINDEAEPITNALMEATLKFKPGYFSCPIVWETHFILHPRLKTGPGKSGLSRGIGALKNILEKFSVQNRNNMFVYQDCNSNVFYLRLHENLQSSCNKNTSIRSNEFEHPIVSRSPSIASLPLGQPKSTQSEHSISHTISSEIRPRVRSFGEKESKEGPNEDTLILSVHGITEAGEDVRSDLVQVLQNRLDDAVLDFLSVMLDRNSMCPLTPEDVHFIQKPFRMPEVVKKLTIQKYAQQHLDSYIHYLRQNLLQFLNIPKYTDNRTHYHFKDYSESDQTSNRVSEDNIFIYNQGINPSSGNRGIACIALAIVSHDLAGRNVEINFNELFQKKSFEAIISSHILNDNERLPEVYLEFRLWKQGRVNTDNLFQKLYAATKQAAWDIIIEYYLLQAPLCEPDLCNRCKTVPTNKLSSLCKIQPITVENEREIQCSVMFNNETSKINLPKVSKRRSKSPNSPICDDKLNSFESGDDGIMTEICSMILPDWLKFGVTLLAPSVKKHIITLTNHHLLNVMIRELQLLITQLSNDTSKSFRPFQTEDGEIFVPFMDAYSPNKCIIISRNFEYWKACVTFNKLTDYGDLLSLDKLKHVQKFTPLISGNNNLIPRQKLLWATVKSDHAILYTYNWSRDSIDKFVEHGIKLGSWLSVRANFLASVTAQKLGLFYNQAITRKNLLAGDNSYIGYIGNVEAMLKFPQKRQRHPITVPSSGFTVATLDAFRDTCRYTRSTHNDPVAAFTAEMADMKRSGKKHKDELKKLHSMWQSRTSTCTNYQLQILKQNSRIIHYCHTPLLFLPKWRVQSAATRDHSLIVDVNSDHRENQDWHQNLCYEFILEYRRYLQTLGFMAVQIDNVHKKQGHKKESIYNSIFYVQKAMLGGILIFSINLNEPFLMTKLYAIECNRLHSTTSRTSISQFTLSFLDECDKVKILMHLHSFTYDFHLRCMHAYVTNSPKKTVCNEYHLMHFLDDFMKYYSKAPNFARNLIHTDTITVKDLITEGKHLYDYLLINVDQYNLDVFSMIKEDGDEGTEYVLVQVTSTPQLSYKDAQDRQHTDDFEITLIVSHVCVPYQPSEHVLHMKYYLILTSRREIYPKLEVERKLGKFRTVSSTSKILIPNQDKYNLDCETSESKIEKSCDLNETENEETEERRPTSSNSQNEQNSCYMEIKQESVNYLGYYSSHEQLMQQLILDRANSIQKQIKEMIDKGMVDCRTHLLWNKLVSHQETNHLTYTEFIELKSFAKLEHLCNLHPNLGSLLNQPLHWYQGLSKLLITKYNDQNRIFVSADGNIQHFVILHPRYVGAFMLLSIDLHTSRGDLYSVHREPNRYDESDICVADSKALLDGFVNSVCFYLWSGMI